MSKSKGRKLAEWMRTLNTNQKTDTDGIADTAITFAKLHTALVVTESDAIGSNDNDTTIATSAAIVDYVANNTPATYGDSNVATYLSNNGYGTSSSIVASITDSAPTTLDTLNELAAALGDDPNFATTTATNIGTKLAKSSNLSDLTNAAHARTNLGLGTVATSDAYADLTGKPTIPTNNNQLTNGAGYTTDDLSSYTGGVNINTSGTDFVLRDDGNGGGIDNYFWRDHSAAKLYLGTPDDNVHFRSTNVTFTGEAIHNDYIMLNTTGTATSTTSYPSNALIFRGQGWDTNGGYASSVDWYVRAETTASVYPDCDLVFYEQSPSIGHKKVTMHGRGSGANYIDPLCMTVHGTLTVEQDVDGNHGGVIVKGQNSGGVNIHIQDNNPEIRFEELDRTGQGKNYWFHQNSGNFYILCDRSTAGSWTSPHPMRFHPNDTVDIFDEFRLEPDGDLHIDGNVIAYSTTVSDQRLKDNIDNIESPLDKICALRGVTYDWNAGPRQGERDYGLIAQECESVIPEIVREKNMPFIGDGETDYKTVDYEKLTAVLIEAIKEQQQQIEELKEMIGGTST